MARREAAIISVQFECWVVYFLFIYLLILLEKSQDAFPYNATYIQRLQLKSRALPFSMQ